MVFPVLVIRVATVATIAFVFPVVVSEETIDKVTLFCAAKRNGGMPPGQPGQPAMAKQKSEDPQAASATINTDY